MPTILVPLEEQTVALALLARQRPDESLDAVFRRTVNPVSLNPGPTRRAGTMPTSPSLRYKITLCGEELGADSLGRLLTVVIGTLAELDARCLERIAREKGRTRPIIAKTPEALFPGSPHLKRHVLPLAGGWYVGTNVSRRDVKRILKSLCAATGLCYGVDLVPRF